MNNEKPVHKVNDNGYYESHVDSYCRLGDSFDRGFENGTTDWSKVTCKNCLKQKTTKDERVCLHNEGSTYCFINRAIKCNKCGAVGYHHP